MSELFIITKDQKNYLMDLFFEMRCRDGYLGVKVLSEQLVPYKSETPVVPSAPLITPASEQKPDQPSKPDFAKKTKKS